MVFKIAEARIRQIAQIEAEPIVRSVQGVGIQQRDPLILNKEMSCRSTSL
jgi:hypothetical protein